MNPGGMKEQTCLSGALDDRKARELTPASQALLDRYYGLRSWNNLIPANSSGPAPGERKKQECSNGDCPSVAGIIP